jgi:SAM-dependent methyltransferase
MRQSVVDLRTFYASALGTVARRMIARKISEVWSDLRGLDVLAFGYATPFLEGLGGEGRRVVAAMPAGQGAEPWPLGARNRTCLAVEGRLPFPNAFFDRILAVHALEEGEDPPAILSELSRVLSPSGRLILAATARRGAWALAERTPFGHGRSFSRGQIEERIVAANLTPVGWTRALYAPPWAFVAPWADGCEQIGARLLPGLSGVILIEAVKQVHAVRPRARPARVPARARPVFAPSPAGAPRSGRLDKAPLGLNLADDGA